MRMEFERFYSTISNYAIITLNEATDWLPAAFDLGHIRGKNPTQIIHIGFQSKPILAGERDREKEGERKQNRGENKNRERKGKASEKSREKARQIDRQADR